MKTKYKEEVEEVEKILCEVDKGEIRNSEAIYKLMKLTLKYKNARLMKLIKKDDEKLLLKVRERIERQDKRGAKKKKKIKIGVKNYPALEQEVLVGDRVEVDGYSGVVEKIKRGQIFIRLDRGNREIWNKDFVQLLKRKKRGTFLKD